MPALPPEILNSLQTAPGFDREAFEHAHLEPAQVSIRINPFKPTALTLPVTDPVPWCREGFYLPERPSFTYDPLFHAGCYYVQEPGSMFLAFALREHLAGLANPKVLDLCAAPGGKSTLLASLLEDRGVLVSNEIVKSRIPPLVYNLSKWGISNSVVTNNEPSRFAQIPGFFDVMVVDAPCSGSGLFRKQADALDEWSEAAVQQCSQRQQQILIDALPALSPGGLLFYSTCSFSVEEDEDVVQWLIREGYQLEPLPSDPAWGLVDSGLGLRFYPDKSRSEGFFCALLRKPDVPEGRIPRGKPVVKASSPLVALAEQFAANNGQFVDLNGRLHLVNPAVLEFLAFAERFYLRKAGAFVGDFKGQDLIPSHELALSCSLRSDVSRCELSYDDAIRYLKKESFSITNSVKGLSLMSYGGYGLGWAKILGNRINNYLPLELRILK